GGENITVTDGRVCFEGGIEFIPRANLCLASAERVQILLARFKAVTFDELFEGVKSLPLEEFIGKSDSFPVKGHSLSSKLSSVPACQSIIKKAAADRLCGVYKTGYMEETGAVHQLQFNILKDEFSLYLDTSGAGLHKRGYRRNSNAAPIKETLAAGIVDISMVKRDTIFCDPFCGSGTFLIEAAYKALNIAPGLKRTFAAEKWRQIPAELWKSERTRAMDGIIRDSDFFAYGYDIDPQCVELSIANCTAAGVKKRIRIEQADIRSYQNKPGTLTVCNPPYGERMLELKEAEELYREMGKVFLADKEHPCAVISPHEDFEKFFGKQARKRRKLYNGMIKCQLYSY
ncbi:MAG: class I SAM-dependent RNA methyltransferase, partial [Ruminococcus sp.]|nr:class I SAM-dependent RNA methyltransferase [Ruminococcus sp.]